MKASTFRRSAITAVIGLIAASPAAFAYEAGDWIVRVGAGSVDPKSDNGDIVSVDSGTMLVFNGTYMFSPTIGLEVLASLPFSHDIKLAADGTKVGETKHLPPTISLQYHFETDSAFKPYVGAGVNYTIFFKDKTTGPLTGMSLDLDNSIGLAAQLGFDYDISDNMFVNLDARWIDIDTDAKLDGVALETVKIDPLVYSVTLGWTF